MDWKVSGNYAKVVIAMYYVLVYSCSRKHGYNAMLVGISRGHCDDVKLDGVKAAYLRQEQRI